MSEEQKYWYLENFSLFEKVSMAKLKQIESLTCMTRYKKNEPIYTPEQMENNIFFLKKGKVKISTYTNDGEEFIKTVLRPGEIFGRLPFSPGSETTDFAYSLGDCIVCYMPAAEFENMVKNDIELNAEVMKFVGYRLKKLERRVENLSFKDSKTRLIELLIDFAEDMGKKVGTEYFIEQNLSHREIASLTATSRQTTTKALNQLREKGLIDFNRKKIIIRDMDALEKEKKITS